MSEQKQVSENSSLKLQICLLRQQVLSMQHEQIVAEQKALIEAMRAEVGAAPEDRYDPASRRFVAPPKAVTEKRQRPASAG